MRQSIQHVFVGTYSRPILFGTGETLEGKGIGIYSYGFDSITGNLKESASAVPTANPSFLTVSRDRKYLYAVNELKEYEGKKGGALSAYRISEGGELSLLNQKPTNGTDPCHVTVDANSRCVMAANFMSGSICCYPLREDGSLGETMQFFQHQGHGKDPVRQAGPHAHSVVLTRDECYAVVPDLGMDCLMIYPTDFSNGGLRLEDRKSFFVGSVMGPRFCVFNRRGDRCYLFCEIASQIMVLRYCDGAFETIQTCSSLVAPCETGSIGADIHLSPDDRFLYASNRGQDTIVSYRVADDGTLSYVQTVSTYGKTPRNFAIDRTGKWLLVGNQDSDTVTIFERDADSGMLKRKDQISVPTPVCIWMGEE